MVKEDKRIPDRPGGYTMTVVPTTEGPSIQERREARAAALAAWLLDRWRSEQKEAKH